jgi:hypothetical protein
MLLGDRPTDRRPRRQRSSQVQPRLLRRSLLHPSEPRAHPWSRTPRATLNTQRNSPSGGEYGTVVPARRRDQLALARTLRDQGKPQYAIAAVLRSEYGLNARVAMRLAHRWSQADAAREWNRRWPDDPKTFKNFSYWENWPSKSGYMPSLTTLDRLAQLYECRVADLLADWGDHRKTERAEPGERDAVASGRVLAMRAASLELPELTDALGAWVATHGRLNQQALLLKISTAAALAASVRQDGRASDQITSPESRLDELVGAWLSRYRYHSSGRAEELEASHLVELRAQDGRLVGRSAPDETGSVLSLELAINGTVVTGTWTERTSPAGYYRAATYHGTLQLVVDPTSRSMTGQWLGVSKRFTVKSGAWSLLWDAPLAR